MIEKIRESIPYYDKEKLTKEQLATYRKIGEETIKEKKYAVVTMAGGQGTSLRTYWTKGKL